MADALSSLKTHEAIISGEAVELPVRATIGEPDPFPKAEDPSLEPWKSNPQKPSIEETITDWRDTYN
jgi:hypothetical protein